MTNTSSSPSIAVSNIVACVESALQSLVEGNDGSLSLNVCRKLEFSAQQLVEVSGELIFELRLAVELLKSHGVEISGVTKSLCSRPCCQRTVYEYGEAT